MDQIEERLSRMEDLLHQLAGMVGKSNSVVSDLKNDMSAMESRLNARIDGVEQRLSGLIKEVRRDVTVLQSESDHLAQKIGVLERDVSVLRNQS